MTIETAVLYLVALALPIWLVVEEIVRRQRQQQVHTQHSPAPARARQPVSRATA